MLSQEVAAKEEELEKVKQTHQSSIMQFREILSKAAE